MRMILILMCLLAGCSQAQKQKCYEIQEYKGKVYVLEVKCGEVKDVIERVYK